MIKDKEKLKRVGELLKKSVFKFLSNEGSIGKTIFTLTTVGVLEENSIKSVKFACDHSRQDLVTAYGSYSKGELEEIQDPAKGVGYVDSRTEADQLINNLSLYEDNLIIEDHKAGSLDEQKEIYPSARSYVKTYERARRILWYFIPVATADKSLDSINVVADTFRGVNTNDTVQFVFILNKGMMYAKGGKKEIESVMRAYDNSEAVGELKATGNVYEIVMDAQLSENMVSVLKNTPKSKFQTLQKEKKMNLFDYDIILEHFEIYEDQLYGIFEKYLSKRNKVKE